MLLAVLLTSAGLDDGVAAPTLLGDITPHALPRLVPIVADQKYRKHALDVWMAAHRGGWRIEVKARPAGTKGFTPLEKRWVIERTNAWHGRYRRNSKDGRRLQLGEGWHSNENPVRFWHCLLRMPKEAASDAMPNRQHTR